MDIKTVPTGVHKFLFLTKKQNVMPIKYKLTPKKKFSPNYCLTQNCSSSLTCANSPPLPNATQTYQSGYLILRPHNKAMKKRRKQTFIQRKNIGGKYRESQNPKTSLDCFTEPSINKPEKATLWL